MKQSFIILILAITLLFSACAKNDNKADKPGLRELTVYCAEPFSSKELWSDFTYFEARNDCRIIFRNFTDSGEIVRTMQSNGDSLNVDVLCSIPGSMITELSQAGLFSKSEPENRKYISEKYFFDKEGYFIPYALSYLCLAYDSKHIQQPPLNFGELQDNHWAEAIIMPDPIKTGIGRSFMHFSAGLYGKNGFRYLWDGIQKNFLQYTDSYDEGYRRFLAEEGFLIPAMITQMRYHRQNDGDDRIRGVIMKEGTFRVTENVAILKKSKQPALAKRFIDYLLEKQFQRKVWEQKWMYPVNGEVITELFLAEDIAMYESKCKNPTQAVVKKEETLWLKKLKRTLDR